MRRTISALLLCGALLTALSLFLFPPTWSGLLPAAAAKDNVLLSLLNLPAPPPPNPLVSRGRSERDPKFYNKSAPPADNAPIAELLDYWQHQSATYQDLRYSPEMTAAVRARIIKEIGRNPKLLSEYLNVLSGDADAAEFVKEMYDREGAGGAYDKETRKSIKKWLTYNSPYFSSDLARLAGGAGDSGEYVSNQEELLALTRVDFDKAQPLIDRLYSDGSLKTSRVLAKWALYRHALLTGSTGDIDRYRDELKDVVEDKTALPGMRDLAMDALVSEKEWSGRDEWYYSLLADETLADLRVGGASYTGLTTLMLVSPDEKYIDKMVELAASGNVTVRSAAVRNLLTRLENGGEKVIRVMLPWLEDPNWATDISARQTLVRKLSEMEMPESVPGLIKILDEKQVQDGSVAARMMSNSANMAANAASTAINTVAVRAAAMANANTVRGGVEVVSYPYRYSAVSALAKQKDLRAVPALRRILPEGESYERSNVIGAILDCGGFSIAEQLAALETSAKGVRDEGDELNAVTNLNANYGSIDRRNRALTAAEIQKMLGDRLLQSSEISDELARGIVTRINELDRQNDPLAAAYRKIVLRWQNAAINIVLLNDVKQDRADADTIIRLLSQRKDLREKQSGDIFDLRTGKPMGIGIAPCLLEDTTDYDTILSGADAETKTSMLACARLIRAPLPVSKVAENLTSDNELLVTAAERYIESEDSIQARSIILARHQNEARIMGATSAFFVPGAGAESTEYLWALYQSLGNESLYNGWSGSGNDAEIEQIEKMLQEEVKKNADLLGVYAYNQNYIRIYKDRVIYSWDEDDSRYRERPLSKYEFDEIRAYLTNEKVDEQPPYLSCGGEYCEARELVMLGRNGGRRVYMNGDPLEFFVGLDRYFEGLRQGGGATLKYTLSRDLPGLEIVLASDTLHAETVWGTGNDIRVAASDLSARQKVEEEIERLVDGSSETENVDNTDKITALTEKKRSGGRGWYAVSGGESTGPAQQPSQVEFIVPSDALAVQPAPARWRARTAEVELRTNDEGIFKVVRGKITKLQDGAYSDPAITPNGRWALATKVDDRGSRVVRIDLVTNRERPVETEEYGKWFTPGYIATLNRFLVARDDTYDYQEYQVEVDDTAPRDHDQSAFVLLDAATGALQPIAGEYRPISQQTFRPLQVAARPGEYWAAIPDFEKNETQVGIYSTKVFGFTPVLTIPKITFNSMGMWVDEAARKVYFVYRGHALSLPMRK